MSFTLFFITIIAFLFGIALTYVGYKFFILLLPIWGFVFGFMLGASAIEAILNIGFLTTVLSWVVGFIAGTAFAVLSYLFYAVAVGVIAGSLGYMLGASAMAMLGFDSGLLVFMIALAAAVGVIFVTFIYNLQKYVIIAATSYAGAAISISTLMLGALGVGLARITGNPIQVILDDAPIMVLVFLGLLISGIYIQIKSTKDFEVEAFENKI